jgi:hypothetical protein
MLENAAAAAEEADCGRAAQWMRQWRLHTSVGKGNVVVFSRNRETLKME